MADKERRSGQLKNTREYSLQIARKLEALREEGSPYISVEKAAIHSLDTSQTYDTGHAAEVCINDIAENGNEAISHLCLPAGIWRALKRANITTITELKEKLSSGTLRLDHAIGKSDVCELVERLYDFEVLVATQNYNRQLAWANLYIRKSLNVKTSR